MKYSVKPCNQTKALYIASLSLLVIVVILGICSGSTDVSFLSIFDGFDSPDGRIILYVRLPRVIASLICGGALAVSGVIVQAVLANNLASPSIVGINAGAGLGIAICALTGMYSALSYSVFSFAGALVAAFLICVLSFRFNASKSTVILIGVAVNSIFNALTDIIVSFSPDISFISSNFKLGSFSSVTMLKIIVPCIIIFISLLFLITLHNDLDVLTLGDSSAKSLGMNTGAMRVLFLIIAALFAGCSVSIAGLLSFVGLVVPHIVRRFVGVNHLHLILLSFINGAGFVCLCDTLSRKIFSPYDIPVGIIISVIGAPFFLAILSKKNRGELND